MTSVPPPSEPPASLHTHPELPDGVVPSEPPPGALSPDGKGPPGSLSPVPAWAPLAAMIAAFVVATLAYLVIAAVVEAGGGNVTAGGPPGLVISATLVQDAALIIAAAWFASHVGERAHPGLVRAPARAGLARRGLDRAGLHRVLGPDRDLHLGRRPARPAGAHARPQGGGVAGGADRLRRAAGVRRPAGGGVLLPRVRVRRPAREDRDGVGGARDRRSCSASCTWPARRSRPSAC